MGEMVEKSVADWVGRPVEIVDGIDGTVGETGVVLAVDDTPYRPSAWVKVHLDRDYPAYRSCDLCWLRDIDTDDYGPAWGTGGPEADAIARRSRAALNDGPSDEPSLPRPEPVAYSCERCGSLTVEFKPRLDFGFGVQMDATDDNCWKLSVVPEPLRSGHDGPALRAFMQSIVKKWSAQLAALND